MIGKVVDVSLVILLIAIVNILYNSIVYHQVGKSRYIRFSLFTVLFIIVLGAIGALLNWLMYDTFLSVIFVSIDAVVYKFVSYIPLKYVFIWFLVPLCMAWVFFGVKGTVGFLQKKKSFIKWQANQQAKLLEKSKDAKNEDNQPQKVEAVPDSEPVKNKEVKKPKKVGVFGFKKKNKAPKTEQVKKPKKVKVVKSPTNNVQDEKPVKKQKKSMFGFLKKKQKIAEPELPENLTFDDSELSRIRPDSMLSIKKALDLAKNNNQMQVGKTDDGYVVVYATTDAEDAFVDKLDPYFDEVNLAELPCVAFITDDDVVVNNLKDYVTALRNERAVK